jgi:hypothetical protein
MNDEKEEANKWSLLTYIEYTQHFLLLQWT